MTQKILVGYDGSEFAETALDWAIEEARSADGELIVVVSTGRQVMADAAITGPFLEQIEEEAEKTARRAVQKAQDAGVSARGILERGDVAGVLVNESRDSSLVVLGKRGRHGLRGRLGSVSAATAAHAECPVIVLPESSESSRGDFTDRVVVAVRVSVGLVRTGGHLVGSLSGGGCGGITRPVLAAGAGAPRR